MVDITSTPPKLIRFCLQSILELNFVELGNFLLEALTQSCKLLFFCFFARRVWTGEGVCRRLGLVIRKGNDKEKLSTMFLWYFFPLMAMVCHSEYKYALGKIINFSFRILCNDEHQLE